MDVKRIIRWIIFALGAYLIFIGYRDMIATPDVLGNRDIDYSATAQDATLGLGYVVAGGVMILLALLSRGDR
ncbi:hypothetical protein [Magnetofaba australis]|uniref:Uncharacterized protein n=1 Tax=Magnetofaba australis IT-1 TaxID=1434232 RepID=A0A1Y2K091_9PROT|nr:hypothetical protein [Magnetofaba australis]OSM01389.1 hypothetical protein MAIT1_01329 [Magnetofaba australis IT-1]